MASAKKSSPRVVPRNTPGDDNSTEGVAREPSGFGEAPQRPLSGTPLKGSVTDWANEIAREADLGPDAEGRRSADIPGRAPETGRRASV